MSRHILPEPPDELKRLSGSLASRIRESLDSDGKMPFSRFMEMALYEPGLGYYSAGLHKLGASGDYTTAPELGPLFATCLARQAAELGESLGEYDILEIGAGTGQLAFDLLQAIPPNHLPNRYRVLERSADLRRLQQENLAALAPELGSRVEWLEQPPGDEWQGLLLANEVLDALAVERFLINEDGVDQLCVATEGDRFCWATRPAPAVLRTSVDHAIADIGIELPAGYQSEINPFTADWLKALCRGMSRGLALFIDYGYPRREYYLPERSDGTLMCHYRHRAHDDVFFWPGLQDITAWVDFTALAEAADENSLEVEGYCSQTLFLIGCGMEQVLSDYSQASLDGGLEISTQARQLTMPGMMGEKFQVMGLGRGLNRPLCGFSLQDLRHRL